MNYWEPKIVTPVTGRINVIYVAEV